MFVTLYTTIKIENNAVESNSTEDLSTKIPIN